MGVSTTKQKFSIFPGNFSQNFHEGTKLFVYFGTPKLYIWSNGTYARYFLKVIHKVTTQSKSHSLHFFNFLTYSMKLKIALEILKRLLVCILKIRLRTNRSVNDLSFSFITYLEVKISGWVQPFPLNKHFKEQELFKRRVKTKDYIKEWCH